MVAILELIGAIGPCQVAFEKIHLLKNILVDPDMTDIQTNVICALLQLGFTGLRLLVELASKDFNSMQSSLLGSLLNIRTI